jgi:hypothetical protein
MKFLQCFFVNSIFSGQTARATKNRSWAYALCGVVFCSAIYFCARNNAAHFSLSGAKKRQLQPDTQALTSPLVCLFYPNYIPDKELVKP